MKKLIKTSVLFLILNLILLIRYLNINVNKMKKILEFKTSKIIPKQGKTKTHKRNVSLNLIKNVLG